MLTFPETKLIECSRFFPNLWQSLEQVILNKKSNEWDEYMLIPQVKIVEALHQTHNYGALMFMQAQLTACTNWRYSKFYYTFTEHMISGLETMNISELPVDELMYLPAHCVYVDITRKLQKTTSDIEVYGFFAHLDVLPDGCPELRLIVNTSPMLDGFNNNFAKQFFGFDTTQIEPSISIAVKLEKGKNIEECLFQGVFDKDKMQDKIKDIYAMVNKSSKEEASQLAEEAHNFNLEIAELCIKYLSYICSKQPDLDIPFERKLGYSLPPVKRTKKGIRLFEAKKIAHRKVGAELEKKVSEYRLAAVRNGYEHKEPHIRSAHFHRYWVGSTKDDTRKITVKWLQPTVVRPDLAD